MWNRLENSDDVLMMEISALLTASNDVLKIVRRFSWMVRESRTSDEDERRTGFSGI